MARETLSPSGKDQGSATSNSVAVENSSGIPSSGVVYSSEIGIAIIYPIKRSHRPGPMNPNRLERHRKIVTATHGRRIVREIRKAFGDDPDSLRLKFEEQFLASGESFNYMAQDLKEQKGVRLGVLVLRRISNILKAFENISAESSDQQAMAEAHPAGTQLEITSKMVVQIYRDLGSIRKTAEVLECSENTVRKALNEEEEPIRPAGRPRMRPVGRPPRVRKV